tara:strand:+ start:8222 stop:8731 length:510 start_codon:yes stop_codon:yes gene_type:complete
MIIKVIMALVLTVAVGMIGLSELGVGVFKFMPQSEAQAIIEEGQSVEEGMDLYSLKNDGVVLIGDPSVCPDGIGAVRDENGVGDCDEGQKTLHYVREAKLLKEYVGKGLDDESDPWRIDVDSSTLERVVSNEQSCREINNIKQGTSVTEPVPSCDSPEGEASFCCVSDS